LAGYYTQGRNLTYVLIKDGSHMVPYDKPIECLDMINRFIDVGDNTVKGMKSQVGNAKPSETTHENKEEESTKEENKEEDETKSDEKESGTSEQQLDEEQDPTAVEDKWSRYYNWGTGALIAVILFTMGLCCCWYQNNHRTPSATAEFGGAPQRQREGVSKPGLLSKIKNMIVGRNNGRKKLRLDDNDETNEL
jgi:carboxypeptidase D